ncbi:winged helix-turn-helix domain-containing protein [Candidatus Aalborgicola defluviihabitans]|uniref:winged helix-turn-helix domain-containing protein n=1 Tax=Candidatus Aalborgicola defluviihabitans TaxID=3386187 RepID=UPI001ED57676|nr:LysR family transcriptional regulator [Burkholderiales bacterium]
MKKISVKPVWTIHSDEHGALSPRLIELLAEVHRAGSLLGACQQLGISYRHGWDVIRGGEAHFNTTLLHMERGQGLNAVAVGRKADLGQPPHLGQTATDPRLTGRADRRDRQSFAIG